MPSVSRRIMVILRPSFSWYCIGVSHIQIPIVSGSILWPSLKQGGLSRSDEISRLKIYDFPVRHGPTIAITQSGSVILWRTAMASSFITRLLRVTSFFFLKWFVCLSHSQSFGRHRGIALPLTAFITFWLFAFQLTVCVISSWSRSFVSLPTGRWSSVSLPDGFLCCGFLCGKKGNLKTAFLLSIF